MKFWHKIVLTEDLTLQNHKKHKLQKICDKITKIEIWSYAIKYLCSIMSYIRANHMHNRTVSGQISLSMYKI